MSEMMVWVDLETTGLDAQRDHLLEVCVAATSMDVDLIAAPKSFLVAPPAGTLETMDEVVVRMHEASGLVRALTHTPAMAPSQVDDHLCAYIQPLLEGGARAYLAGSSIHFDRSFLARYAPRFLSLLHHRVVDVSTVHTLARAWNPTLAEQAPKSGGAHRAEADILDSMALLRHYRTSILGAAA